MLPVAAWSRFQAILIDRTEQVRKCMHCVTILARTSGKIKSDIESVSRFALQLSPETCFAPIHIQRVTREMRTEMRVGFHVTCPVLLSELYQKLNKRQNCPCA